MSTHEHTPTEPYSPRPVRFLELAEPGDWRLKLYGISYETDRPADDVVEAAKPVLFNELPTPAVTQRRFGVGFGIVHQGRDGNFALLCWWDNENELERRLAVSPASALTNLERQAEGPIGCVWDLAVIGFEREYWIGEVLSNPDSPSIEGYLNQRFSGEV